MSPPCSSVTQQQLRLPILASSAIQTTPSLWWPLLENMREKQIQCLSHCKVQTSVYVSVHYSKLEISFLDLPIPVRVRAEATDDNTSIGVSWEWSHQRVPMCVDLVKVHYRPKGGSLMMYTVENTTATSATLPNLQCNTKYTIWVYVESGNNKTGKMSAHIMVSLPGRGTYVLYNLSYSDCYCRFNSYTVSPQLLPLPLMSLLSSQAPQVSG